MKKFKYIWWANPIDFFENGIIASRKETERVLEQMPETPRDYTVYKCVIPYDSSFAIAFVCKADNNGTTYMFSDENIVNYFSTSIIQF